MTRGEIAAALVRSGGVQTDTDRWWIGEHTRVTMFRRAIGGNEIEVRNRAGERVNLYSGPLPADEAALDAILRAVGAVPPSTPHTDTHRQEDAYRDGWQDAEDHHDIAVGQRKRWPKQPEKGAET